MAPVRTTSAAAALLLLSGSNLCQGQVEVETCQDLLDAFELTKTQDVEVVVPNLSVDFTCPTFTTMSMNSNTLTVLSAEAPCEFCGTVNLDEIRFEVTNGAKLFWEPPVIFTGTEEQDVNGGAVYVGIDSTVRFYNDMSTSDVGIRSVTGENTDFAGYRLSGGCVYVDGYFRVDGDATFTGCENGGGGESSPGPGGVMFVNETGSVLFAGEVTMREVSIIDDEGNDGGGIYNMGKVNIKGDAVFEDLRAEGGGAIFNAAGAEFRFKSGATVTFNDCLSFDSVGGAVYNSGFMKFAGPTIFFDSRAPALYVGASGETTLSKVSSVFWGSAADTEPAVQVAAGGSVTELDSAFFANGADSGCATVFYEDGAVCLD